MKTALATVLLLCPLTVRGQTLDFMQLLPTAAPAAPNETPARPAGVDALDFSALLGEPAEPDNLATEGYHQLSWSDLLASTVLVAMPNTAPTDPLEAPADQLTTPPGEYAAPVDLADEIASARKVKVQPQPLPPAPPSQPPASVLKQSSFGECSSCRVSSRSRRYRRR